MSFFDDEIDESRTLEELDLIKRFLRILKEEYPPTFYDIYISKNNNFSESEKKYFKEFE